MVFLLKTKSASAQALAWRKGLSDHAISRKNARRNH